MRNAIRKLAVAAALILAMPAAAMATGLATCDSGSEDTWQSQEALKELLTEQGWDVRRIKVDGGCYEVYALDDKGERVEAYFHPQTFERVPTDD